VVKKPVKYVAVFTVKNRVQLRYVYKRLIDDNGILTS